MYKKQLMIRSTSIIQWKTAIYSMSMNILGQFHILQQKMQRHFHVCKHLKPLQCPSLYMSHVQIGLHSGVQNRTHVRRNLENNRWNLRRGLFALMSSGCENTSCSRRPGPRHLRPKDKGSLRALDSKFKYIRKFFDKAASHGARFWPSVGVGDHEKS
jgi:hypothetical protein